MLYNASEPAYDLMNAGGITPRDLEMAVAEELDNTLGTAYTQKLMDAGLEIFDYSYPYYVTVVSIEDCDENWWREVLMYDNGWTTTGFCLTPGGDLDIYRKTVDTLDDETVINHANVAWYINHYSFYKGNGMDKPRFNDVDDAQKYLLDLAY